MVKRINYGEKSKVGSWKRGTKIPTKPKHSYKFNTETNKREMTLKGRIWLSYRAKTRYDNQTATITEKGEQEVKRNREQKRRDDEVVIFWLKFKYHPLSREGDWFDIEMSCRAPRRDKNQALDLLLSIIASNFGNIEGEADSNSDFGEDKVEIGIERIDTRDASYSRSTIIMYKSGYGKWTKFQ